MNSFLLKVGAANAVMYVLGFLTPGFSNFAETWIWMGVVAFYFVLTMALHRWLNTANKRSPMQFITAVNGSTAIKMLTSLAIVTAYLVVVGGEYRIHFSMGLFIVFAVNTFLLVMEAQTLSRKRAN
jgi:hypothetical protein